MSKKFEDISRDGVCDVCGKQTKVAVFASSCGPVSYAYCEECAARGLEPYGAFVAEYSLVDEATMLDFATRNEKILNNFYHKTKDQFLDDCKKTAEELKELAY